MLLKQFPAVNNHILANGPQTSAKQTYNKGFQTVGSVACRVHIISIFLLLTYHQLIHLHYLYFFEQLRKLYSGWHEVLIFWTEESQYGRCCRGREEGFMWLSSWQWGSTFSFVCNISRHMVCERWTWWSGAGRLSSYLRWRFKKNWTYLRRSVGFSGSMDYLVLTTLTLTK